MIRAIETVYNGYRFRSRLEARWAVFFDAIGIKYQYEPEGFDLGEAGWYLPDFFLPEVGYFVEVKPPGDIPGEDLAKIRALDDDPPDYALGVLVAWGDPDLPEGEFDQRYCFFQAIRPLDYNGSVAFASNLETAILAARQARFEHKNGRFSSNVL